MHGAIVAVLLASLSATTAQAQVPPKHTGQVITHAEQLAYDPAIRKHEEGFAAASSGMVVYGRCREVLGLSEAQQDFVRRHYDRSYRDYIAAFDKGFRQRIGIASPAELQKDYARYLADMQAKAVSKAEKLLASAKDCKNPAIKPMVSYFDALEQREAALNAMVEGGAEAVDSHAVSPETTKKP